MNKLILATGLAAALCISAAAGAAPSPSMANKAPTARVFAKKVAITNLFEIQAGQIAKQKIQNEAVDNYADMIVNDHQKMQDQLKSQAENVKNVKVPSRLDKAHEAKIKVLKKLSGAKFLKTFKAQQVDGHEQAIKLLQSYAQYGQNSKMKTLAKKGLPVMEKHLRSAKALPTSLPAAPTVGSGSSMQKQPAMQKQ